MEEMFIEPSKTKETQFAVFTWEEFYICLSTEH